MDKFEHRRLKLISLMDEHCNGKPAELAQRLKSSDSYVLRMLYPEGKEGRKRIGEQWADKIALEFNIERSLLELPTDEKASLQPLYLQWNTEEEKELLSLFRATDEEGRTSIMEAAKIVPKILLRSVGRN